MATRVKSPSLRSLVVPVFWSSGLVGLDLAQ